MAAQIAFMKIAIRDRIRSHVIPQTSPSDSSSSAGCELTDDGRPTTLDRGLVFFAVHSGKRRNNADHAGSYFLDEYYDFKVTISMKSAYRPRYRFGDLVIDDVDSGIQMLTDLVVVGLNGYLSLSEEANALMTAAGLTTIQPFVTGERPVFKDADDPKPQTATWFGAKLSDKGTPVGVSIELRFQGLRLIREIGQS